MPPQDRRYVLITPCRNEARYARRTLETVTKQTIPPALWVIVDDGSKDDTPRILAEYARRFNYIRVVHRHDRGRRSVGSGVVHAFYAGYETIDPNAFEYVCKLDLDLELPPRYFHVLIERMEAEPRLGTCSGKPVVRCVGGLLRPEKCGSEMSVGMTKFYRRSCFQQIGGFVPEVMWDGIDCHRCRMLGWIARSWDDEPDLRFVHLRQMGSSDRGVLAGRRRHGRGQYFMGTSPLYMTLSSLYRALERPRVVGGLAIWCGYVDSFLRRKRRYADVEFRHFLRRYQWLCMIHGKSRATKMIHEERATNWDPARQTVGSISYLTRTRSTRRSRANSHSNSSLTGNHPVAKP